MTYPSRGEEAITAARTQSEHGPAFTPGMCLREVRECYQVGPKSIDATSAWEDSPTKHRAGVPPRGVPVWWTGGSAGHGHVAISAGDGLVWSPDSKRAGYFDRVGISTPHEDWNLTYAGWTEDINGVRVYLPPMTLPPNFKRADRALTRAMRQAGTEARRELAARLRRILRKEFR